MLIVMVNCNLMRIPFSVGAFTICLAQKSDYRWHSLTHAKQTLMFTAHTNDDILDLSMESVCSKNF